jgi:hypothetical protein
MRLTSQISILWLNVLSCSFSLQAEEESLERQCLCHKFTCSGSMFCAPLASFQLETWILALYEHIFFIKRHVFKPYVLLSSLSLTTRLSKILQLAWTIAFAEAQPNLKTMTSNRCFCLLGFQILCQHVHVLPFSASFCLEDHALKTTYCCRMFSLSSGPKSTCYSRMASLFSAPKSAHLAHMISFSSAAKALAQIS